MEDFEKLINEGTEDQVVNALRELPEEWDDRAEYARLLIQKGLRHLVYPVFCDPSIEAFGTLIGTKDVDIISGLTSLGYCLSDYLTQNFWDHVRDIQKMGDLNLFKYFISSVRFSELISGRHEKCFNEFKENPELTDDECSIEFDEVEKLLLLAQECIKDDHKDNLVFLEGINFLLNHENPEGLLDEASFKLNDIDLLSTEKGNDYLNRNGFFSNDVPYYFTLSGSGLKRVDIDPDEFRHILACRG